MKIAINICFGGFGVSAEALKELIKRGSKAVESTPVKTYYGGDDERFAHLRNWEEAYKNDLARCNDVGDGYVTDGFGSVLYKDGIAHSLNRDEQFRTDPALIAVIEEMGQEKASSRLGKVKVVEIPDGVAWGIHEYDGMEHVEEKHQTWS